MNTDETYHVCKCASARIGLVTDIWRWCILPRLDEFSVDMLMIMLGCEVKLTTKHFIHAIMQRDLGLVNFIAKHVPICWRVRMCAEFYGDELRGHSEHNKLPAIARCIRCYAGKCDPGRNMEWGFRASGTTRARDCHTLYMTERVLSLAAIGQLDEFKSIPEVLDPSILHGILRIALLFEQHNVVRWCVNVSACVQPDHFTHARSIEMIRFMHACAPKVVPARSAYVNAFGTPAYAELCAIAEFPDHNLCQRVHDGASVTDYEMTLAITHEAAMVFGRADLFASHKIYTTNKELNVTDHNIIKLMHTHNSETALPIRVAMMHGCVDTLAFIMSIGIKFRDIDMLNAILLKDKQPAILEWMFSTAEYYD